MRNKPRVNIKLFISLMAGSLACLMVLFYAPVFAIARGYLSSDSGLQTGMVVALGLGEAGGSSVERATQESSSRVVGIVTTVDNSLVTVSSLPAKVLVESEGQPDVYVSDINGQVSKGDLLVLSPLKGILMKASDSQGAVIGIAADSATQTATYSYQDGSHTKDTKIAKIKINLNHQGGASGTRSNDSTLAKIGRAIAGKEVSEIRVLVALILFVLVLIAEGAIIYGAVSSAIVALGRNPLGRKIINGELIKVVAIALLVLLVGLAAVYGVLRV